MEAIPGAGFRATGEGSLQLADIRIERAAELGCNEDDLEVGLFLPGVRGGHAGGGEWGGGGCALSTSQHSGMFRCKVSEYYWIEPPTEPFCVALKDLVHQAISHCDDTRCSLTPL